MVVGSKASRVVSHKEKKIIIILTIIAFFIFIFLSSNNFFITGYFVIEPDVVPTACPKSANGLDYYVSSINPNANDNSSNDGKNCNTPWRSFDTVISRWNSIPAGATIHLERGSKWTVNATYQYWLIDRGGTPGNPITIRGDDYGLQSAEKPNFRMAPAPPSPTFIVIRNASHLTIRDLAFDGGMDSGNRASGISVSPKANNISNIQILNNRFYNLGAGGTDNGSTYIVGIGLYPSCTYSISDCLIEGNEVSGFGAHGLNHYPPHATTCSPAGHINNTIWRNNYVHSPAQSRWYSLAGGQYVAAGMHYAFSGTNNIIENNLIVGDNPMGGIGIDAFQGNESGLIIRNNVFRDNSQNAGITIWAGERSGIINADIYNNLFLNNGSNGFNTGFRNNFTGTINIYNNTFYGNCSNSGKCSTGELYFGGEGGNVTVNVKNNIFVNKRSLPLVGIQSTFPGIINYSNNLYNSTGSTLIQNNKTGATSYTASNIGQIDSGAVTADPLFVNVNQPPTSLSSSTGPNPNGFSLQANSPAINRGVSLGSAYVKSINLLNRPQGSAWDIGAYEFGTSQPQFSGLIGKYTFEETGNTAVDSSTRSNPGTIVGAVRVPGRGGSVMQFSGGSEYAQISTKDFSLSQGTVSLWGLVSDFGEKYYSGAFFMHNSDTAWNDKIHIYPEEGMLKIGLGNNHELTAIPISLNTWYHIALSWQNGNYSVYLDGVKKVTGVYTGLNVLNTFADIGNTGNPNVRNWALTGKIDDVQIYNTKLSDAEVLAIYNEENVPECTTNSQCSDGLYCNGIETCSAGKCVAGTAPNCNDNNPETIDSCNETLDKCDNVPGSSNCPTSPNGLDYYLSSINSSANDSYDGKDCTKPWKSYQHMKNMWASLPAGATIHVERGSYFEWSGYDGWAISSGGNATAGHKTIRGDDYGDSTKPKPEFKRVGSDTHGATAVSIEASYVTVRDLIFDGGHADRSNLHTVGISIGNWNGNVSNVNILNNRLKNLGGEKVVYVNNIQQNQDKYICGISTGSRAGFTISNVLIEGNEISEYNAHGLRHYTSANTVNMIWRNNYVHNNYPNSMRWDAGMALAINFGGSGNVFEYNYLEDLTSDYGGIVVFNRYGKSDTSPAQIRYNVVANSPKKGIWFEATRPFTGTEKVLADVYGNLIFNSKEAGILVADDGLNTDPLYANGSKIRIFNNTLYNNTKEIVINEKNVDYEIRNNIIFGTNSNSLLQLTEYKTIATSNNLYWSSVGADKIAVNNKGTSYSIGNVKNYESTAQNTNPLFVSLSNLPTGSLIIPNKNGLMLQSTSPAIDNGINLGSSFAVALGGDLRGSAWDIGAYEIGGSVSVCGNGVLESGEQCEGNNFGSFGNGVNKCGEYDLSFDSGNLFCSSCQITTNNCVLSNCKTSTLSSFQNNSFSSQNNKFVATWNAIPIQNNMDGLVALSSGAQNAYLSFLTFARFAPSGIIDVWDGSIFRTSYNQNYFANTKYFFRMVVDVVLKKYSVYVRPEGGSEKLIADNYNFNSNAQSTNINNYGIISEISQIKVCDFNTFLFSENCTYTYSAWSNCINNKKTRSVISAFPSGCIGSPTIITDCILPACTDADWSSSLTPLLCPPLESQTKTWTKTGNCEGGVNHPSTENISCDYNAPICNYTYSDWSNCNSNGFKNREVTTFSPDNCQGNPELTQSCIYIPLCTQGNWNSKITPTVCPENNTQIKTWTKIGNCSGGVNYPSTENITCNPNTIICEEFDYSSWSECSQSGTRSRTIISATPFGCVDGNPELNETCNQTSVCKEDNWQPILSPANCPESKQQIRTWEKVGDCVGGITKNEETISCEYPPLICTAFEYNQWGICQQSNIQSRTISASYPAGCVGGNPSLIKNCTYTPENSEFEENSNTCNTSVDCTTDALCVDGKCVKLSCDVGFVAKDHSCVCVGSVCGGGCQVGEGVCCNGFWNSNFSNCEYNLESVRLSVEESFDSEAWEVLESAENAISQGDLVRGRLLAKTAGVKARIVLAESPENLVVLYQDVLVALGNNDFVAAEEIITLIESELLGVQNHNPLQTIILIGVVLVLLVGIVLFYFRPKEKNEYDEY